MFYHCEILMLRNEDLSLFKRTWYHKVYKFLVDVGITMYKRHSQNLLFSNLLSCKCTVCVHNRNCVMMSPITTAQAKVVENIHSNVK